MENKQVGLLDVKMDNFEVVLTAAYLEKGMAVTMVVM